MKIALFKNMKGLIHGPDPKRISCDYTGVLKIGKTEIDIESGGSAIMPQLFYGSTGNFEASFTVKSGEKYDLGKVAVRSGWIHPPDSTTVELMELRCRADEAEDRIASLEGLFDTNALNFLI